MISGGRPAWCNKYLCMYLLHQIFGKWDVLLIILMDIQHRYVKLMKHAWTLLSLRCILDAPLSFTFQVGKYIWLSRDATDIYTFPDCFSTGSSRLTTSSLTLLSFFLSRSHPSVVPFCCEEVWKRRKPIIHFWLSDYSRPTENSKHWI